MVDRTVGRVALRQVPDIAATAEKCASEFRKTGTAVGNTQVAKNKDSVPEEWTGAAADAASAEIVKLGGKTETLSQAFDPAADAVDTWISEVDTTRTTVTSLQEQWDEAIATYDRAISDAKEHYTAGDPSRKIQFDIAAQTAVDTQNNLKKQYDEQLDTLAAAAQTAANSINAARQTIVSDEAMQRGRDGIGAAIFPPDEMPTVNGAARWAEAQAAAGLFAYDLEKAANSDKPLTEEEVQALQDKWGDKLKDPFYVQAMMDHYRSTHPGQENATAEMLYKVALNAAGSDLDYYTTERTARNPFIASLGTAMVLSTGGYDAQADHQERNNSFAQVKGALIGKDGETTLSQIEEANIAEYRETLWNPYKRFADQDAYSSPEIRGAEIFTQAAGLAAAKNPSLTLGAKFYQPMGDEPSLASEIMRYDHQYECGKNLLGGSPGSDAIRYSLVAFDENDRGADALAKDPMQTLYMLSDTPDELKGSNAPAALQTLEGNRLMHLRNFLNGDTPFDVDLPDSKATDGKINVARYLTGNRIQGGPGAFLGTIDQGEALGDMLADASSPEGLPAPEPQRSDFVGENAQQRYEDALAIWKDDSLHRASTAANVMAGYQDGLDRDNSVSMGTQDKYNGEDVFGRYNPKLRSWMGEIIKPYVFDLASEMHNTTGKGMAAGATVGEYNIAHMQFGGDLIDRFKAPGGLLQDLAFDRPKLIDDRGTPDDLTDDIYEGGRKPALQVVQTAAYTGYMTDVATALQDPYHDARLSGVQGATHRWTELIQEIFDANPDKDSAIGKALDESHKNARKIADFIVDQTAGLVTKKVPVAGALIKVGVKEGSGEIFDWVLSTDNETKAWKSHSEADRSSHDLMQDGLIRAMYDSDQWTERAGMVDVTPGTEKFAEKALPGLDPDGTRRKYDSLTDDEKKSIRNYFRGANSDFREILDEQFSAQQDANANGATPPPSKGVK